MDLEEVTRVDSTNHRHTIVYAETDGERQWERLGRRVAIPLPLASGYEWPS